MILKCMQWWHRGGSGVKRARDLKFHIMNSIYIIWVYSITFFVLILLISFFTLLVLLALLLCLVSLFLCCNSSRSRVIFNYSLLGVGIQSLWRISVINTIYIFCFITFSNLEKFFDRKLLSFKFWKSVSHLYGYLKTNALFYGKWKRRLAWALISSKAHIPVQAIIIISASY